jgi:hypothetical protein
MVELLQARYDRLKNLETEPKCQEFQSEVNAFEANVRTLLKQQSNLPQDVKEDLELLETFTFTDGSDLSPEALENERNELEREYDSKQY